jgi:cytoskeletal protein CcmA (bactofilin family)
MWKPSDTNRPPANEPQRQPMAPPPVSTPTQDYAPATNSRMTATPNVADQATIGKSLVIKGEVTGSESLYVDGRVEGSITLPGNRVTVGRNGVVSANVTAREVVIQGKVRGNITATDRVDIRNEGSLTGDVIAQRISIEDGAYFKGGIDIRKPNAKDSKTEPQSETASVPVAARA